MSTSPSIARPRRVELLLFCATFLAFAYFHQGGGWNQNSRFAMVRSTVEEGHLWIDSYLVYVGAPSAHGGTRLVRVPIRRGELDLAGRHYALAWMTTGGPPIPLADVSRMTSDVERVDPADVSCTGDLAWHGGHFYPAKAPGLSLLALPAYWLVHAVERQAGADPDDVWTLTLNSWLVSVLTVALTAALGSVLVYRLALAFSGGAALESLLTALTFAFGTMVLPYGTMFYEHDVVATALLASFYLLHRSKSLAGAAGGPDASDRATRLPVALAGACAGYAAISNYLMAVAVVLLGTYLAVAVRRKGSSRWFALGVLGPFALICGYNIACFATPFTTNYRYETPMFQAGAGAFLGVFLAPRLDVLLYVLVSPFRGLFYTSPVLLMGVYGLGRCFRERRLRSEAWLMSSIVLLLLLFMCTFNGWEGGWAVGPRYLVPALPFLAAPLVFAFRRFFWTTSALAVASAAISLLVTAVDPQSPVTHEGYAGLGGRPKWSIDHLRAYEWPLFTAGRAWPILAQQREREPGLPPSELSTIEGPVSVNPIGVYEGWMYRVFPAHSPEARWNSFNLGELLFPQSRWSLAPLLLVGGALVAAAIRAAKPKA